MNRELNMYCPGQYSHHGSPWYKISTWATTTVSTVLSSPRQGLLQGLYLYLKEYSIAQMPEITCFFVGNLLARCFDNGKEHS